MSANLPPSAPIVLDAGNREHELVAALVLIQAKIEPMEKLAASMEAFGSAVKYLNYRKGGELLPLFTPKIFGEVLATVTNWRARNVDVRMTFDRDYPSNLRSIYNKPPLIFVKGVWREGVDSWGVAVVGTRKPSDDGLRRAAHLARKLAEAKVTVISGLARGIDGAAHAAALAGGGRTIAVMGTGLDRVYPREHAGLARDIVAAGGALMTQFFPDQPPTPWTFPMRNVVMSGLSVATVVVEASKTSGARKQARNALEHGRTVLLLRSLVEEHEWAREMAEVGEFGARGTVVESADDVIQRVVAPAPNERLAV
jgi:DNA protecting protein DprA